MLLFTFQPREASASQLGNSGPLNTLNQETTDSLASLYKYSYTAAEQNLGQSQGNISHCINSQAQE